MALIGYTDKTGHVYYQDKSLPAPSWYKPDNNGTSTQSATQGSYDEVNGSYHTKKSTSPKQQAPIIQQPVIPQFDIAAEMQKLKQAQIDAQIAGLGKAKTNALSNLNQEKTTIAPTYQAKRNQTATASQMGAKNFAEFLARRGSSNSGVANQAEIARNVSLQGEIGALNTGESNAFSDIARRSTDVSNAYESDVASARAGAEAEYMRNYISEMQRQQSLKAEQDRWNQQFGAEQQWKDISQQNWQKEFERSNELSDWERDFKERGFTADQARSAAELELARQKAYTSGSSAQKPSATQQKNMAYGDLFQKVQDWVNQGLAPQQIKNLLYGNVQAFIDAGLSLKDIDEIYGRANGMYNTSTHSSGGHYVE